LLEGLLRAANIFLDFLNSGLQLVCLHFVFSLYIFTRVGGNLAGPSVLSVWVRFSVVKIGFLLSSATNNDESCLIAKSELK